MRPELSHNDLAGFLAPSLGREKSHDVVLNAAEQLGINTSLVDVQQALRIFEHLAGTQGLVGIVARLAKARVRMHGVSPGSSRST